MRFLVEGDRSSPGIRPLDHPRLSTAQLTDNLFEDPHIPQCPKDFRLEEEDPLIYARDRRSQQAPAVPGQPKRASHRRLLSDVEHVKNPTVCAPPQNRARWAARNAADECVGIIASGWSGA